VTKDLKNVIFAGLHTCLSRLLPHERIGAISDGSSTSMGAGATCNSICKLLSMPSLQPTIRTIAEPMKFEAQWVTNGTQRQTAVDAR
jgi:hypothetical protein